MGKTFVIDNKLSLAVVGILERISPSTPTRNQEIYVSYDNIKDWVEQAAGQRQQLGQHL